MHISPIARVTIAGLTLLAVAGCGEAGGSSAADVAKTTDQARTSVAGISAAYNAHDAVKAASYDAPDYVSMFHGFGTAVGPAADIASMKEQFADPAARFDLNIQSVDVSKAGDVAVVRSLYQYTFTDPKTKKPSSENGNWVAGFKRQADGSLKLAWSIGANTPAAASADKPKT
ncbi:MAG: nuclear transport factor 2 family protein [Sphingomonas sp.]